MNIKLDDLQALVSAADFQSFGLAAEDLGISQSALSRRISKLEESLGAQLFDRTTRRVTISKVGKEFLPEARRIIENFEVSISNIRNHIQMRTGEVVIAANNSIAENLLPDILHQFKTENPNISITVRESSSYEAVERVLRNEVELGISQFGDGHTELEFEAIIEDRFVVICSSDHPLADREELRWGDLKGQNYIHTRSTSGMYRQMEKTLGDKFAFLQGDIKVSQYRSLPGLILRNLGITVVPITLVPKEYRSMGIVHIPVRDPVVTRSIGIVTPRYRSLSPAAEALRKAARTVLTAKFPAGPADFGDKA